MTLGKHLLAGIGAGLLLGLGAALLVLPYRNPLIVDAAWPFRFEYWMLLPVLLPAPIVARGARGAAVASGLLFGFTGLLRLGYWEGPIGCGNNSLPACVGRTPNDWAAVTALLVAAAVLMLVFAWRQTPREDRPALPPWSGGRWAMLVVIWVGATGVGIAGALGTAIAIGPLIDRARYLGGDFGWLFVALLTLWASMAVFTTLARSPGTTFAASGLLIGFAGFLWVATLNGSVGCTNDFPGYCISNANVIWDATTLGAFVIGVLLPVWAIRKEASRNDISLSYVPRSAARTPRGHRLAGLRSGSTLISELELKLDMSVVVQSVDESAPVRIHALLRYGPQSREVTAIGPSEADAWRELARMAAEWRNADENLVPLWGGGL